MEEVLIALALISLLCIPKAVLEAIYFQDRKTAKKTVSVWAVGAGCLSLALCLSLLFDYCG